MKAKELLDDASKWTQGVLARDSESRGCYPVSPEAMSWCVVGALCRIYEDERKLLDAIHLVGKAIADLYDYNQLTVDEIEDWNDDPERTFDDVRKVLETADV
jgi:hypothetical protein